MGEGTLFLLGFMASLLALPIAFSFAAALACRAWLPRWSRSKKARISAAAGPALEALFGLWLVVTAFTSGCPQGSACDNLAMAEISGLAMLICSVVAYGASTALTYRIVR